MKKNIKLVLVAIATLIAGNVWGGDVVLPAGTYYFDLTNVSARQIDVFNDLNNAKHNDDISISMQWSDLSFDSSNPLNSGVTQTNSKTFYKNSGLTYFVVSLAYDMKIGDNYNFLQYKNMSDQDQGWRAYSQTNLKNLGTEDNKQYVCIVYSDRYEWQTSGTIPSGTPVLTFKAGSNGGISTHTAGGSNISSPAPVTEGTSVNLVATPDTGYSFYGWVRSDGSVASTLANYVFSMPYSSLDLTATFYSDSTDPVISGCSGCFRVAP